MKRGELVAGVIWVVNFILAVGIFLFVFLGIVLSKKSAAGEAPEPEVIEIGPEGKVALEWYKPVWSLRLGVAAPEGTSGPVRSSRGPSDIYNCVGIGTGADPKNGYVFLEEKAGKKQKMVCVDDSIGEGGDKFTLIRVEMDEATGRPVAVFRTADGKEERMQGPVPGAASAAAAAADSSRDPKKKKKSGKDDQNFKSFQDKTDPATWHIDPEERSYALENAESLLAEMELRPHAGSDGKMDGVSLSRVKPNSLAAKRGFEKDDVIRSVNGKAITSLDQAKALIASEDIRSAGRVTVALQRAGRDMTLNFAVDAK